MKIEKIESIASKIFNILAIILFLILFGLSITKTWVNDWDLKSEYLSPVQDSLLLNILWLLGVLLIGSLFYQLGKRIKVPIPMDVVALVVSLLALAFSVYWVGACNTGIHSDQLLIYNYAVTLNAGDISSLQKGEYLGLNSQQLGLVTIMRVLFKVLGESSYQSFQYLNAVMVPIVIFSGYRIVKNISKESRLAESFYLLLMAFCVPLYGYIPFVYGEMGSTAMVMLAAWMLLDCLKRFSPLKVVVLTLAMTGAILFRQNTLIFFIAFLIVTVVKLIRKPGKEIVISLCGLLLGVLLSQIVVHGIYDKYIPEDSHGMPAILYIAMGINDDGERAGWHNWYNRAVFLNTDCDVEESTEIAQADLQKFFQKCAEDPAYGLDFYYRKVSSQWNVPMYQCLVMNNVFAGEQSEFAASVYFGKLRGFIEEEMNIYQLLVYGGILVLLFLNRKKWSSIDNYLLLIGVFGGFLFTLMWEAKARYVFPYFVVMIPYAAVGIYECVKRLNEKWKRN